MTATTLIRKGGLWTRRGADPIDPGPDYDYLVDGGDIATTIAAAPTNAVILVKPKAGSAPYRITAALAPKAGQTILGQVLGNGDRTVIKGSIVLTSPTSDGAGHWYFSTTLADYTESTSVQCEITTGPNANPCRKREQIFVDGVHLTRVMALSELNGTGEFYEDYAADRVYLGADPAGKTVEMSKTNYAVQTSAWNVKLYGLTIQHFASPSQQGAVFLQGLGSELAHCDVSWNHAIGSFTDGANGVRIYSNEIHHNGQLGVGSHACHGATIEQNWLHHNNTDGYRPDDWEGGDIKVTWSDSVTIQDNICEDSRGLGIWLDIENGLNGKCVIRRNKVRRCYADGIRHEIGYACDILDNEIEYTGFQYAADNGENTSFTGYSGFGTAAINVNTSRDVTIRGNVLGPNQNYIFAQFRPRADATFPNRDLINLLVEGNDSTMVPYTLTGKNGNSYTSGLKSGEGVSGLNTLMGTSGIPTAQYYDGTKNNRFRNNIYRVSSTGRLQYAWNQGYRSFATAQSSGFEAGVDSPDSKQLAAPRPGFLVTAATRDGNWHNTGAGLFSATGTKIFLGDNNADVNDQARGGWAIFAPAIPAGATIADGAAIYFYATGQSGVIPRLRIRAEKTIAATVPTSKANLLTKLTNLTTAVAEYVPPLWTASSWQQSGDLSPMLRELVALPGWTVSSLVACYIERHPDQLGATPGQISYNAYETDPALTANLQATWS